MGIRTRETEEYFPKVKKAAQEGTPTTSTSTTPATTTTASLQQKGGNNNSNSNVGGGGEQEDEGGSNSSNNNKATTPSVASKVPSPTQAQKAANSSNNINKASSPSPPLSVSPPVKPTMSNAVSSAPAKQNSKSVKGHNANNKGTEVEKTVGEKGKGTNTASAVAAAKTVPTTGANSNNKGKSKISEPLTPVSTTTSTSRRAAAGKKATQPSTPPAPPAKVTTTTAVSKANSTNTTAKGNKRKKKGKRDEAAGVGGSGRIQEACHGPAAAVSNGNGPTKVVTTPASDKGAASKLKNGIMKANSKMKKGMRIMMERTNKILERSKNCKKQTKKGAVVKPRIPPARCSARLGRKNSGEGNDKQGKKVCEEPLRTVELIKRPLELRDPATKLLYLATLGLYPTSDPDSDTTPIVIVKEEIISPGGKKGRTRNVEFPLMPSWGNRFNHSQTESTPPPSLPVNNTVGNKRSLLLQIAPVAGRSQGSKTQSVSVAASTVTTTTSSAASRPVKTANKRKSQKQSSPPPDAKSTLPLEVLEPLSITSLTGKPMIAKSESAKIKEEAVQQNLSITIPSTEVQISLNYKNSQETEDGTAAVSVSSSAKAAKKRKSVDTILKEIEIRKSASKSIFSTVPVAQTEIQAQEAEQNIPEQVQIQSNQYVQSSNPILEGLMKNPVKSRAQKRKSSDTESLIQIPNFNSNIQFTSDISSTITIKPISMTVPLQPAPGLPINMCSTNKEFSKQAKNKKQKCTFELPNPVPIPIPPGLLSFASFIPNGEMKSTEKPKKPRKPRAKKSKDATPYLNNVLTASPLMTMAANQYPSVPYLPPNLEAFFQTPPLLNVQHSVTPAQQSDQALDLCVNKTIIVMNGQELKPKKGRDVSKSILKPLSASVQEETPLNLVMSRPESSTSVMCSMSDKFKDNAGVLQQAMLSSASSVKQAGSLDSVKQMLGRLHTKIAPSVNGVRLITIE